MCATIPPMLRSTHAQHAPRVTHLRILTLSAPRTPAEISTAASARPRGRLTPNGDDVRPVAARCRLRGPSCKFSSIEASPVSTRSSSGPGRRIRSSSSIGCHQPLTRGSCFGRVDAIHVDRCSGIAQLKTATESGNSLRCTWKRPSPISIASITLNFMPG